MRRAFFLLFLSGCTTLPPESLPVVHNPAGALTASFQPPGPQTFTSVGARFSARAGDPGRASVFETLAEDDYQRVMADTGLFSFKPEGLYPVFLYKDLQEYLEKTDAPRWSGGITAGNAIYTFDGPRMARTLAHEITHLVFHEYMGEGQYLRWFNEGLAVYEESRAGNAEDKKEIEDWMASSHDAPMTFGVMVSYVPGDSRTAKWYGQSASVARFLVEVGGRTNVERFLTLMKSGASLDTALANAFPTLCDGLGSLEKRWRLSRD